MTTGSGGGHESKLVKLELTEDERGRFPVMTSEFRKLEERVRVLEKKLQLQEYNDTFYKYKSFTWKK